jgi:hypothetical protein
MTTYRRYPSQALQEALEWLDSDAQRSKDRLGENDSSHRCVLLNELRFLINVYNHYFILQEYRESTKERNELAKRIYERCVPSTNKENWKDTANRCLAAADVFLEQSGENKVVMEEVEKALREVLGWK